MTKIDSNNPNDSSLLVHTCNLFVAAVVVVPVGGFNSESGTSIAQLEHCDTMTTSNSSGLLGGDTQIKQR